MCRFILAKGDVQVSDQERAAQLESMIREVASMVCEKCVDPVSRRPYSMAQVRDAMKAGGFMVHPTRNTKQQFLDCVKLLQKKKVLDIERAKMQLALVLIDNDSDASNYVERRNSAIDLLIEEGVSRSDISPPTNDTDTRIIFQSDPSLYRKVDEIARDSTVQGRLEIIQQCVTEEGDVTLGSEMERRALQQQHNAIEEEEARNKSLVNNEKEVDDIQSLSDNLKSNLTVNAQSDDEDQYDSHATKNVANSRKAQKAAQKKSKKAKRREKEEQAERDERILAEKTRQRERAERLGIVDGNDAVGSNNGSENKIEGGGDTKPCNTCGGAFTPGEYRSHFRSDWHRFNVKLKMKGVAPVCEKEFLLCDSDAFFE